MYPIVEGRRREKRGREEGEWRKIGGGQIGGSGNEENSVRAAPKGGGETRGGETQVYNAYHFKRSEKYSDPLRLAHRNHFFGFVLVDFTLLTWNSKKKCSQISIIFLNKRVYILYKVPIRSV